MPGTTDMLQVYVTVGTDHHRFDRLVGWVDAWAAEHRADANVLIQTGTSTPPTSAAWEAYLPDDRQRAALAGADVVICHGGPGTVTDARHAGRIPVVVPRDPNHREHVDDHQVRFGTFLAKQGLAEVVSDERQLRSLLDGALAGERSLVLQGEGGSAAEATLPAVRRVGDLIEGEASKRRGRRGRKAAASEGSEEYEPIRVLFIGGLGRSGSTLLDRILGQVDGMWSIGEVVQIWRTLQEKTTLCGCGLPYRECPVWTAIINRAFGGWDRLDVEEMVQRQLGVDRNRYIPLMIFPWLWPPYRRRLNEYRAILDRLYKAIVAETGTKVIVDSAKHSSYAFLLRTMPLIDLRVVHLVRDSRGVAFSWTKQMKKSGAADAEDMARYRPRQTAIRWVMYNLLFDLLGQCGVPVKFQRYEDLISDNEKALRDILTFLHYPVEQDQLAFSGPGWVQLAEVGHSVDGNPMRFKDGLMELRSDDAWRTKMPARDRRVVTAITGLLMKAYGYRLEGWK